MKRKILSLLSLLLPFSLLSQSIIFENEIIKPGEVVIQAIDYAPDTNLKPGGFGEQFWDFSQLQEDETDSLVFVLADSTPYAEYFPGSNFALHMPQDSSYVYMERTPDKLSIKGLYANFDSLTGIPAPFEGEEIVTTLPMMFENNWSSNSSYEFKFPVPLVVVDSARMKTTTDLVAEVDAWGQMVLPNDTFAVLRVHEFRTIYDSLWVKYAVYGWRKVDSLCVSRVEESYQWWSDKYESGFVVCDLQISQLAGAVESISYLKSYPYLSVNEIRSELAHNVYPNPTKDHVSIRLDKAVSGYIELYSFTGQRIFIQNIINQSDINLDLSTLENGMYLYRIFSQDKKSLLSGKILKN